MTQLAFAGVTVEFGATRLLESVTFTVTRGERWGIIGRNGAGKTTLFRLVTGELAAQRRAASRGRPASRISLMDQQRDFAGAATRVGSGRRTVPLAARPGALAGGAGGRAGRGGRPGHPAGARAATTGISSAFSGRTATASPPGSTRCCTGSGSTPTRRGAARSTGLSGGERGRLGLVRQLVAPADLLLLDEPTNHLDLETTRWLENYLRQLDATVLVVSHDRAFLQAVVDHVLHLEAGTRRRIHRETTRPSSASAPSAG